VGQGRLGDPLRRIASVARKEIRQLLRDPLTTGFVVGVPVVQLLLFGYAINQDIRQAPTALVDHSDSEVSRRLAGELEATQTFRITHRPPSEMAGRRLLVKGDVKVVVVVPPDFARAYYRGRGAEVSVLVDATDPTLARAVRVSANGLAERINERLQPFLVQGVEGGVDWSLRAPRARGAFWAEPELIHRQLISLTVLSYYNPELRTPVFVVPGLLGVILTTTMLLMTALAVVRERERGTFEFLIATPVRRFELMVGKIVPYIAIGFLQIVVVLATGLVLFRVPITGSMFDLLVASVVFIAANLALGLVISSATATQLQATQVCFFFFLPSVLLSGFMFPFEAMPEPAQWLGEVLPLTHFIRIVRGILLRGSPLSDHLGEMGAMLLFLVVSLVFATRLFKKELV
jgi:ABC-2 type transport system permease protein